MRIYRGIKEAGYWVKNIDIERPPATEAEISALKEAMKPSDQLTLVILGALVISFITLPLEYAGLAIAVFYLHFFYVIGVLGGDKTGKLITEISEEQTFELYCIIKNSKSEKIKIYAEGVRRMGRPYLLAEFIAIKNYEIECDTQESLDKAKVFLYGEQRLAD